MSTATAGTESIDTEAAPPSATGLQPDVGFLLETVVSDVHGTILQIATLSLMTASCARLGSRLNLRACRHLMHDDSKIMLLALRYGQEIGLDKPTIDGLTRLYIDMGQAKMALAPLTDELPLTDSGLDSLSFAIVVTTLEESLGVDPFSSDEWVEFPVTFGDFVKLYEGAVG